MFTYGAALEACMRKGNWQPALGIVKQMADGFEQLSAEGKGHELAPTTWHCNALLGAFGRGNK